MARTPSGDNDGRRWQRAENLSQEKSSARTPASLKNPAMDTRREFTERRRREGRTTTAPVPPTREATRPNRLGSGAWNRSRKRSRMRAGDARGAPGRKVNSFLTPRARLCAGVVAALCPTASLAGSNGDLPLTTLGASQPAPVCAPGVRARTCTGPVKLGVSYPYTLPTHCGVVGAYFNGRLWRASPPLTDGSGNPPPGWANPFQVGTMRLRSATWAEFRTRAGLRASFRPAPRGWRFERCE
jgi:hypothetical protein